MSIEKLIEANTAAMLKLADEIALLRADTRVIASPPAGQPMTTGEALAKPLPATVVAAPAENIAGATAVAPKPTAADAKPPAATLDLEKDVLPAMLRLAGAKGREAAVAVLSRFGISKVTEEHAEKFHLLIAAFNEEAAKP
jgi:hypothetical protein